MRTSLPKDFSHLLDRLPPTVRDAVLRGTFEHPDTPRPVSDDALRARKEAIRSGKLCAPSRDEFTRMIAAAEAEIRAEAEMDEKLETNVAEPPAPPASTDTTTAAPGEDEDPEG